jgi:hypothetical protein
VALPEGLLPTCPGASGPPPARRGLDELDAACLAGAFRYARAPHGRLREGSRGGSGSDCEDFDPGARARRRTRRVGLPRTLTRRGVRVAVLARASAKMVAARAWRGVRWKRLSACGVRRCCGTPSRQRSRVRRQVARRRSSSSASCSSSVMPRRFRSPARSRSSRSRNAKNCLRVRDIACGVVQASCPDDATAARTFSFPKPAKRLRGGAPHR